MKETAYILENATEKSLVILDEVGRGTSTKDGIAIAAAVIKHLVEKNRSMVLFATHYHELGHLVEKHKIPNVSFYQACTRINEHNELTCLYKIAPGIMTESHGINVAKMAGVPLSVIKAATSIYKQL
jgi:DNA mismatch repair ATPase MutS